MARKYTEGFVTPKGVALTSNEPLDQRTVVQYLGDLYNPTLRPYPGIVVTVEEAIVIDEVSETLREYKFTGGDSTLGINWILYTGSGGANGINTEPNQFTSFVFLRQVGVPAVPTGGIYDTPVPSSSPTWTDGIPAGTDPLWMSKATFVQNSGLTPTWSTPILMEDTDNVDREYCSLDDATTAGEIDGDGKPNPPLESPIQRDYWHNVPLPTDNYMAIGTKVGGAYPTNWDVIKVGGEGGTAGATGDAGTGYLTSIVFARDNEEAMDRAVVTGGSFSSPTPTATTIDGNNKVISWYDGIPAGTAKVWMSKFTFNDADHIVGSPSYVWTTPSGITDTGTVDFEFSEELAQPADPTANPGVWSSVATINTVWMAQRTITNGVFGAWQIIRIKGETGLTGQGLQIEGRDTIANILAMSPEPALLTIWIASDTDAGAAVPGVVNDAYLFVGAGNGEGGTAWDNIGGITGTDGVSYKYAVAFYRSVAQPTTPSGGTFASPTPVGWSDGIPVGTAVDEAVWMSTRYFADNIGVNAGLADWAAPTLATDTMDFDFKYATIQGGDATPLAPHLAPGGTWLETGDENTVWMAKGQKLNGVVDDTTWIILRIKGETGNDGADGVPSFLSSAYIKTNDDISGIAVTGGTYISPIPTSTYSAINWTDGVPTGDGALWFVQVKFDQTDTGNDKVWPAPVKIADNATVEYNFSSSVSEPVGVPIEASNGTNGWYDDASDITGVGGTVRWMAVGSRSNGVWPETWDIVKVIGEDGVAGLSARTYIPSSMFVRADDTNIQAFQPVAQYLLEGLPGDFTIAGDAPTLDVGGNIYTFTDGIPDRTAVFPDNSHRIWQITAVFNSVDHLGAANLMAWSYPSLLADNNGIDYEYHPGIGVGHTEPPSPSTDPTDWVSVPNALTYWIAQRNWSDGVTAQWVVYKVRGEDGADGDDVGTYVPPDPRSTKTWYNSHVVQDPNDLFNAPTQQEVTTQLGNPEVLGTSGEAWTEERVQAHNILWNDLPNSTYASAFSVIHETNPLSSGPYDAQGYELTLSWITPPERPAIDWGDMQYGQDQFPTSGSDTNFEKLIRVRYGDLCRVVKNTPAESTLWDEGDILRYIGDENLQPNGPDPATTDGPRSADHAWELVV